MKADTEKYILYGIIVIVVGVLGYTLLGGANTSASDSIPDSIIEDAREFDPLSRPITTGTTDTGDVSIELTPHGVEDGMLEVDIAVNTHSVDLDRYDLRKVTTLEYADKVIKPVSAPSLNGHHNSGTLKFDVGDLPESFKITIKGIPAVEERVFRWG